MSHNTIKDVYAELISSLKDLRAGKLDVRTAETMYKGANAIANLIAVETNIIKATNGLVGSGFVPQEVDPFEKEIPQYAVEGTRDCSFCKLEAVVEPDAPSVNGETACDFCLTQPATIFFRKQLENQNTAKVLAPKLLASRLTENHKEILEYLKENGGQAAIGPLFGDSKKQTVTRLLRLEDLRLIECIQRPISRADFPPEKRAQVTDEELHCGIWKITNAGMKAAA